VSDQRDALAAAGGRNLGLGDRSGGVGGPPGGRALAKDAGVPDGGTGSHRLVIDGDSGSFTDPDGFVWEVAQV
jgi:hypothetical protein